MKVINMNDYELDFDAAVVLMDDDVREAVHNAITSDECTEQEFFSAYEKAYEEKFGEEWELSKANPVW